MRPEDEDELAVYSEPGTAKLGGGVGGGGGVIDVFVEQTDDCQLEVGAKRPSRGRRARRR